jgi:carboxyl-terminal processing protease
MRRRVVLGTVLGVLFALGWWVGGGHAANGLYSGLDLFVEVLQTVQANYVDPVDTGKLMTGAMRGVAHGLDPWSHYLDADEMRATRAVIRGSFDGIGASLDQRGGWPVVIAPIEGSPAWEAGVEPGDVITKIDKRSTFGLSPDEMLARLRGVAGTEVSVTVARDDIEQDLQLRRRRITVPNVPYWFVVAPGVGYLRLAHFSTGAGADVADVCDTLRAAGVRALLLDLRGNPGGNLDEAVAVAGQFLPTGTSVTRTEGRAPGTEVRYAAAFAHPELNWPLAVLVDGGSASASEILAGALQDHDRAVLVGDSTFGKGVAQQIYPLRGSQGGLQLTVSHYLTPSGRSIHREQTHVSDEDAEALGTEDGTPGSVVPTHPGRAYRTDAGRIVRAGRGLAPDVRVAADSAATRMRVLSHHPGGLAGAARESLAHDPVFQRALDVLRRANGARGVFAAAGVQLPAAAGARR